MQNNRQLYWGQGQFLTPQHFQQQDLFNLWQQHYYWRLGNPFGWGVVSLQIREEGLAANLFEISRLELVTHSGLVLQGGSEFVHPNARLSSRTFQGIMDPGGAPLSVYVGLPRYENDQVNVVADGNTAAEGALPARFVLTQRERPDLFQLDTPTASISYVDYNVPIFFSREELFAKAEQSVELIKIAELVQVTAGGGVRLSNSYIPPCIHLRGSSALYGKMCGLRDTLTSKGQEFEGLKRQRPDPVRLQMMQTLNRYIPWLHHVTEGANIHPEPTYGLLRQMVGEFSVFSENISVLGTTVGGQEDAARDLPRYDHDRLNLCFDPVLARLQDLIHSMNAGTEAGITLAREGRFYRAFLPPSIFEGERTRYYLMFDSPIRGEQLWQRLRKTGKVSTIADMQQLLQQALFGLRIDLLPSPPDDVPQRGGNKTFFQIDTRDLNWQRIREQQNIALYCDLEPSETTVKLFLAQDN